MSTGSASPEPMRGVGLGEEPLGQAIAHSLRRSEEVHLNCGVIYTDCNHSGYDAPVGHGMALAEK